MSRINLYRTMASLCSEIHFAVIMLYLKFELNGGVILTCNGAITICCSLLLSHVKRLYHLKWKKMCHLVSVAVFYNAARNIWHFLRFSCIQNCSYRQRMISEQNCIGLQIEKNLWYYLIAKYIKSNGLKSPNYHVKCKKCANEK